MTFINLNVHSKASMLYGSADIKKLVARVKELGQEAVGLTDYSNLFNAIKFYKECQSNNIKPILGVDVCFCEDAEQYKIQKARDVWHILLLAENEIGWKNITRIVSASHDAEHFYYNPRVDFKLLEKHKEGVIFIDGGTFDGIIAAHTMDKEGEAAPLFKAEGLVRRFLKIFDKDHFFLSVQDHGLDAQKQVNNRLRNIATKYGIRTVATNNSHYVNQSDAEAHRTLLQMAENQYNKNIDVNFSSEDYFVKSRDEIKLLEKELDLTKEIADRCNVVIDTKIRRLPKYQFVPDGHTSVSYLRQLAHEGLLSIERNGIIQYMDRLDRELKDIEEMGFSDYFLIVHDVIAWTRKQDILLGYGRGSVGGSLVAYCLGITEIDPLKYDLIWERFLNKGRGGLPDIDTDIPRSRRQEVLSYIRSRFGEGNVAQLVTFNSLQARAVLKEVFRVYQMDFEEANKITSLVPAKNDEHVAITLDEAIEAVPELKAYEEKYKSWFAIARALEGCYKSIGMHAAAVVISDVPFEESSYPLVRTKDGDMIFGWDMGTVDALSLLKLDILGLATLDDIDVTRGLIKSRHKIDVNRQTMPLDDLKTYTLLENGFSIGVFQLEKQLGKNWLKKIKPKTVKEIGHVISVIRPGPLESGLSEQYAAQKEMDDYTSIHPKLTEITKSTHGQPIYQEQLIFACQQLAGMSLIDSDKVRSALGKKKPEELKKWREVFVAGCVKNDVVETDAVDIWEKFEKFAGYSFNFAHALGYALLAYETAYLKANYPLEFFCAKLRNAEGDAEKLSGLVYDAKLFDIQVIPPLASSKRKDFSIVDNSVVFGLGALKGVGVGAVNDLNNMIDGCTSIDDVLWRRATVKNKVTSAMMLILIKSGAFDDILEQRIRGVSRFKLLEALTVKEQETVASLCKTDNDWIKHVKDLSDEALCVAMKEQHKITIPNVRRRETIRALLMEYHREELFDSKPQRIVWEQEYLGISLSGSEADVYRSQDKCVDLVRTFSAQRRFEIAVCVDVVKEIVTKKGDPMAFLTAHDNTYQMNSIVVFPNTFSYCKSLLEKGNVIRIRGKTDDRGSLIADSIERLK